MIEQTLNRAVEILLVEDNPGDVALTAIVLREGKVSNNLSTVEDGITALAFLHCEEPYQDAPVLTSFCSVSTCPGLSFPGRSEV